MMNIQRQSLSILLVVSHPVKHSLCNNLVSKIEALLEKTADISYTILDLYRSKINVILTAEEIARKWPLEEIAQQHIDLVRDSSILICIHPDWWGAPPALLVGWIQKIFVPQIAFRFMGEPFEHQYPRGLFGDKSLYVINTTDSDENSSSVQSLRAWWKHIATYSSMQLIAHHTIPNVRNCKKSVLHTNTHNIIEALKHSIVGQS